MKTTGVYENNFMNIVFDMDNTLTYEFGATVRPGILELLTRLKNDGHNLILWTNSRKDRARQIIIDNNSKQYFSQFIYREDHDPDEKDLPKDIRKVNGDILIDDDPKEIKYIKSIKKKEFLISVYRKNSICCVWKVYRIVHFATHGYFDIQIPELSCVVLSRPDLILEKERRQYKIKEDGYDIQMTAESFNPGYIVQEVIKNNLGY